MLIEQVYELRNMKITSNSEINITIKCDGNYFLKDNYKDLKFM